MAELQQCEFFLLRYAPDAVKNEFVNIGVVLWQAGGFAGVRFTRDWRRVRCLDADADVETLGAMEEAMRARLQGAEQDRAKLLRVVQDTFSNAVQLSAATGCLAEDPAREIETLARLYLETTRHAGAREASGRQAIVTAMREAFERAGVWTAMRKSIKVSRYTHAGDPLKLDCGYRPNGVIRLFHAVSLASDVDAAKVLAFSYPQIAEGVARVEKASAELTAVVEPDLDRADEAIGFALQTLEHSRIAVATTAEMPAIAERARVELRM